MHPLVCYKCARKKGNTADVHKVHVSTYQQLPGCDHIWVVCDNCGNRWWRDSVPSNTPGLDEAIATWEKRKVELEAYKNNPPLIPMMNYETKDDLQIIFEAFERLPNEKKAGVLLALSASIARTLTHQPNETLPASNQYILDATRAR